ncbi:hypothetical protein BJ875DRAFT_244652 [Amylocarpus encephaloides]|uniref:DASH complex subunit DAD1 n=1 Tax=Amylocarpus encephaloides TaxID=45428 RepID=A0A9P7YSY4_9HELO|nr:hypothetical protein BJ875DRAFT_244652 [Amylocarpus encephaloides]
MSTNTRSGPSSSANAQPATGGRSFFEQQRELLLQDINVSFEHVLHNINKLNRSLEGVIAVSLLSVSEMRAVKTRLTIPNSQVGNEFSSVEALWSTFENVMAKDPNAKPEGNTSDEGGEEGEGDEETEVPEPGSR